MKSTAQSKTHPAHVDLATRNAGLDLVRGLAILFVILHHLALPFRLPLRDGLLHEALSSRLINMLTYNGYSAVFVFFVLSGFLITRRAIDRYGDLQALQWREFYRLRFARIAPLLLALLLILSLLHLVSMPGFVIDKAGQSLPGALFAAVFLHINWYEGQLGWLPANWDVLWSLSIEELFYLLFPLVCLRFPRPWLIAGLLALLLSLPVTRAWYDGNGIWQEKAYLPGMSAIAGGVLAALLTQAWQFSKGFARALLACALFAFVLLLLAPGEMWRALQHGSMLMIVFAAMGLVLAMHRLALQKVPRSLQRMGKLSYELYLTHMFVVLPIVGLWRYFALDLYWGVLVYPVAIALCVLLASWTERLVSRPAYSWLSRAPTAP